MKKQTKNLTAISFLFMVLMVGGVFAQSYLTSTKEYKPLPLPENRKPLPYDENPTLTITYTNDGSVTEIVPDPVFPKMPYFIGSGYISNQHGKGLLIDFKIKNDGNGLVGTANIDRTSYYIKGYVSGSSVSNQGMYLDMVELNIISTKNGNVVGTFKGNLEFYEEFKVMKGTLYEFKGKDWNLHAFGMDYEKTPAIIIEPSEDTLDAFPTLIGDSKEVSIGKAPNYW